MNPKKILFIAYELPPLKTGGIYRPIGFLRHLNHFGYQPIVITLSSKSRDSNYPDKNFDRTYGNEVMEMHNIVEIDSDLVIRPDKKCLTFFQIYFSPNGREAKGWSSNYHLVIEEVIKNYAPKLIFVTAPPFSVIDLALSTSKKFSIPLVIDLRDAWSNWFINPYGSYLHYFWKRYKERKAIRLSNAVVVTSKQTIKDFITNNPRINPTKFKYIPNGFDVVPHTWINELGKKDKIRIGYVGSFYYDPASRDAMLNKWYNRKGHRMIQYTPNKQDWLYRSPYFFFMAIQHLLKLYPDFKNHISIEFAGQKPEWMDQMVVDFGIQEVFVHLGYFNHQHALEFQREMDVLLITSSKVIGGYDYSIAGKTFEYFQNQKPVLAFVCEGAQKEIMQESGMAIICNPDDTESSAILIKNFIEKGINLIPNQDYISGFERKKLTAKLAEVFDELTSK